MAKIIVIDDSKMMRLILRRILEKEGHEVEDWDDVSAMEILDRITAAAPDLVITDFSMPGCNGATVAKMAHKVNPELPVLAITATHDPAVIEALRKQDIAQVLHKPLKDSELLDVLSLLLP
jgi:CheY-like chemotaxis protein